jgi:hypothetical protein
MNSPFANIYFSLLQQLSTILVTPSPVPPLNISVKDINPIGLLPGATPSINYIDLDYGQLDNPKRASVSFPCVLIDFKNWKFDDLGQQSQKAQGQIIIRLAADPYDNTSSITPVTNIESGLSILDIEWQLYCLLQGFRPSITIDPKGNPITTAQPMTRTTLLSDNRHPGLRIREITFSCAYTDFSAQPTPTTVSPSPTISPEIDNTI